MEEAKQEYGIFANISNEDYHGMSDFLSNSDLGTIDYCPKKYRFPQPEDKSDVFTFGSATHTFILEGAVKFESEYIVYPSFDKRTKEGKARWSQMQFEAANTGKSLISSEDVNTIVGMRDSVLSHPFAVRLLSEGKTENSVFWNDGWSGLDCRCRPDHMPDNAPIIVDLKTSSDCSATAFQRSCVNYGYARQAAFYLDGVNAAYGEDVKNAFCFIVVEKTYPFRVATYILDSEFIDWGRYEYRRIIEQYQRCVEANRFDSFTSPTIETITKPRYL